MNKNLKKFNTEYQILFDVHGNVFADNNINVLQAITSVDECYYPGRRIKEESYSSFTINLGECSSIRIQETEDVSKEDVKAAYDFIYDAITVEEDK